MYDYVNDVLSTKSFKRDNTYILCFVKILLSLLLLTIHEKWALYMCICKREHVRYSSLWTFPSCIFWKGYLFLSPVSHRNRNTFVDAFYDF